MLNKLFKNFEFNGKSNCSIMKINNVQLPKDYLEFMSKHNGGEGPIGENGYACLFKMEELFELLDKE